jgi:hypothetical protein
MDPRTRTLVGAGLLAAAMPFVVFVAQARYDGLGQHPGRLVVAIVLIVVTLALLTVGGGLVYLGLTRRPR